MVAEYARPRSIKSCPHSLILFLGKGSRGRPGDEAKVSGEGCAGELGHVMQGQGWARLYGGTIELDPEFIPEEERAMWGLHVM